MLERYISTPAYNFIFDMPCVKLHKLVY